MKLNFGMLALFISVFFAGLLFSTSVNAQTKTNPHYEWKETKGDWSECVLTESGYVQTKTTTFSCESKSGNAVSECAPGDVREPEVETKDCAPKLAYCHANEGASGYTYHFNSAWVAHLLNNGTPLAGHELDYFTFEGDRECVGYAKVCNDSNANNYQALDNTKVADNSLCTYDPEDPQDPTPNPDVCANIDGVQTSVPEGLHLDAGKVNCVSFSVPGVPESSSTGQVLGTSTSQVLGASTMASTGVAADAIFNSIFALGSLLTSFGIMRNGRKNSKI